MACSSGPVDIDDLADTVRSTLTDSQVPNLPTAGCFQCGHPPTFTCSIERLGTEGDLDTEDAQVPAKLVVEPNTLDGACAVGDEASAKLEEGGIRQETSRTSRRPALSQAAVRAAQAAKLEAEAAGNSKSSEVLVAMPEVAEVIPEISSEGASPVVVQEKRGAPAMLRSFAQRIHRPSPSIMMAVAAWLSMVSAGGSTLVAMDKFKVELKDGTCSIQTMFLFGALFQLSHNTIWLLATFARHFFVQPRGRRSCKQARRSMGFHALGAAKHASVGCMFAVSQLFFYSAIYASNATFAATMSLLNNIIITIIFRYAIAGKTITTLHAMILVAVVLVSVGFTGLQASHTTNADKIANIGIALLFGVISATLRSLTAVFSELVFSQEGASNRVPMVDAVHQTANTLGALTGIATWTVIVKSASQGRFDAAVWAPWSGPGPILSGLKYAETVATLFTLQLCGALPFVLVATVRLAVVYVGKVILLNAAFSIWEACICAAVVVTCALYMTATDVMNRETQAAALKAVAAFEEQAARRTSILAGRIRRASISEAVISVGQRLSLRLDGSGEAKDFNATFSQ